MASKEQEIKKTEISEQNINNPQTLEDSIKVLEKELQNTKQDDYLKLQVLNNQIQELKELQHDYLKLEQKGITQKTKIELQKLFQELGNQTKSASFIGEQIHTIENTINIEKKQRKDTIDVVGNMTMRDYIEKYVKFDGVLNSIRETEFMTKFYDILTVNYIDYIQNSPDKYGLELLHKNLNNRTGIILSEQKIKDIIELTIVEVLENLENVDDVKINISLKGSEPIKLDLGKIKLKKIYEIDIKKTDDIVEKINNIDSRSTSGDIENILSLIQNLEKYRDKIVTKYTSKEEIITIQSLKDELKMQITQIIYYKVSDIKKKISSNTVKSYEEIDTLFENIKNQINDLKIIKKDLNIDDTQINIQELEGYVNLKELYKILGMMNISNIKNVREKINEKVKQFLIYNKDGDFIGQVNRVKFLQKIEEFKDGLNEKLLYTYLSVSGIESIKDRSNISSPELLTILRNAIKEGEIDLETMSDIIKKGYTIAFLEEFNGSNKEQIIKNLSDNEAKWKKIFGKELGPEIGEDNAKKLFILSFIESSATPNKKSESGAIGRFQILPGTAKDYIDEEIIKEAENKMKNNIKTKGNKYTKTKISKEEMVKYILNDPELSAKVASKYLKVLIIKNKEKFGSTKNIDEIVLNALFLYNGRFTERLMLDDQSDIKNQNERLDDEGNDSNSKNEKNDLRAIINKIFESLNSIKIELLNGKISVEEAIKKIESIDNNNFNKKISKGESNFRIVNLKEGGEFVSKNNIIDWIDKYTKEILNQQYSYPEQVEAANKAYEESKKKKYDN